MRRYWKYAKPYLSAFITGPILMIVEVIGAVVMPVLLSNIIDKGVIGGRGTAYIVSMGLLMTVTALIMMAGGVGGAYSPLKPPQGLAMICAKTCSERFRSFPSRTLINTAPVLWLRG